MSVHKTGGPIVWLCVASFAFTSCGLVRHLTGHSVSPESKAFVDASTVFKAAYLSYNARVQAFSVSTLRSQISLVGLSVESENLKPRIESLKGALDAYIDQLRKNGESADAVNHNVEVQVQSVKGATTAQERYLTYLKAAGGARAVLDIEQASLTKLPQSLDNTVRAISEADPRIVQLRISGGDFFYCLVLAGQIAAAAEEARKTGDISEVANLLHEFAERCLPDFPDAHPCTNLPLCIPDTTSAITLPRPDLSK